jgi:hypothetical protein
MNLQTFIDSLAAIAGKPFDYPTQELAKNFIISDRAALIRRQFEQTRTFPSSALISLCIDLEERSSTECCGIDLGCKVVVSTKQIPVPLDVKDEVIFDFVGDVAGLTAYGYIKPNEVPFIKFRKFSGNLPYYTWINRRLVFFNKPALEKAKLRYIPSNPLDAANISDCSGKPCFDIEDTMFIEDHWIDALVKMVAPKLGIKQQQISTTENGGNNQG